MTDTPAVDRPAAVECATCSGRAVFICSLSEPGALIFNYRCQGECREGGHIAHDIHTGDEARGGPVFERPHWYQKAEPPRRALDGGEA